MFAYMKRQKLYIRGENNHVYRKLQIESVYFMNFKLGQCINYHLTVSTQINVFTNPHQTDLLLSLIIIDTLKYSTHLYMLEHFTCE